ncbi:MAG: hypothetical protein KUG73_02555 [Pseudomonadales bacterium]|nr:hypothetical protein [Pseudomonadales bacterium]
MSIRIFLVIFGITLLTACGGGGGGSSSASDRASLSPLLGLWSVPDFIDPSTPEVEEFYVYITSNGNVDGYVYISTIGNCYTKLPTLFTLQGTSNDTYIVTIDGDSFEVDTNFNNDGELSLDDVGVPNSGPTLLPTNLSLSDLNECTSIANKGFVTPSLRQVFK